jgi:hypothetical protein
MESLEEKMTMATVGGTVVLRNEDVAGIVAEITVGHRHLRTTVTLADGSSVTFQEATVAALVRAYVAVKTDPVRTRVELKGAPVAGCKPGYAGWQLQEQE